uniref:Uncharacterized protein n=1 Tax=Timema shepardi TaxID=629360 RepID=A0A7R9AQY8_TIMSH|nr:unnamed protein product [Timema shepardi]
MYQKTQPEFDPQLSRPRPNGLNDLDISPHDHRRGCTCIDNSYASQINDIICPEHDPRANSILIPHPSDCTKYYECSNGVSVLENCPPGLEFNPILFVCDWPNRAGCVHGCAPLIVENDSSWEPYSCVSGKSEFGAECSIQCASGYERSDIVTIQCTTDGWNSTDGTDVIPHCKHTQGCAPLSIVEGSSWTPTSCVNGKSDIGTECSIQCDDDYERSGSNSIQCTGDGWNSTDGIDFIPSCKQTKGCAPLNIDESSSWAPASCGNSKSDIGTECSIQCADGYESSGSVSIQCTTDGWNSTEGLEVIPSCKHTQGCAPLNFDEGSSWASTSCVSGKNDIGTECSIQCAEDYEWSGSVTIQCCAPLNVEVCSSWAPTSCSSGNSDIGTVCSIHCVDGYERCGSVNVQCTAYGWNSTDGLNVIPSCKYIQGCAPLNVEEGSLWIPTSCANGYNEIGTECSIQCVDGYERSGSDSIQCTADGWNSTSGLNVMPTCNHIQGCAPLNVEEGSLWIPTSCGNGYNEIGTECSIQCFDGYERSGSDSIQCTADGWNSTSGLNVMPTCNHIQGCAPLNIKNSSSWAPTSCVNGYKDYGTEYTIECAGGYERKGSVSIQCTTEGWNSTDGLFGIPSCELIPGCAPLNINIGSSWAPTSCVNGYNDYGTECSIECADGYARRGCAPLNIKNGSSWAPMSCVNAYNDYGKECSIECAGGYERKGSVSVQCTTDGWNSTDGLSVIPSCELIPGCAPLNINIGSSWEPTSCVNGYNDYGTECIIECAGGYERKGSVNIQCTTDGWNSTEGLSVIPSCELIQGCAPLDTNIGSSWAPTSCVNGYNDYGTECSIECADGYARRGSASIQCTTDGWNSTDGFTVIPSCEIIPGCAPLNIKNGSSWAPTSCVNGYSDYGTECTIECAGGYERKGSVSIQCTTDGWNSNEGLSVIPSCELIPGCAPLNINIGSSWAPVSCVNGYNDYGTECSIECADGYARRGSVSIQCTTDGWNSTDGFTVIPSCELIPGCAPLDTSIGSSWAPTTCVNGYNDYGTECSIACADGYERKGSVTIQCTTDGWNSTDGLSVIPSCDLIPGCSPLNINIGSSWAPTSCVNGYNDYGTECSIECADGYERKGSVSIQCTTDGWNSTDGLALIPSCEPIPGCAPLNTKNDSSWSPTSCVNGYNDYGTECSIECPDGYERSEISSIQCTPDGWNSTAGLDVFPSCTLIPGCFPMIIKNGSSWSPTSCVTGYNDIGTDCTIACADGYQRSGSVSVQCTADGWNSTAGINFIPSCKSPSCIGEDLKETVELSISNPGNILFVMDQSGSIGRSNYKMGLDFMKNVINGFPLSANRNAGVVLFDSTAVVAIPVNQNSTASFLKGVDGLGYNGGGTDITAALLLASQEINDNGSKRPTLVILITDGISKTDPTTAAQNLKDAGHTLFTIGVTQAVDMSLMEQWASKGIDGSLYYLQVKTYADLKAVGEYFIRLQQPALPNAQGLFQDALRKSRKAVCLGCVFGI